MRCLLYMVSIYVDQYGGDPSIVELFGQCLVRVVEVTGQVLVNLQW